MLEALTTGETSTAAMTRLGAWPHGEKQATLERALTAYSWTRTKTYLAAQFRRPATDLSVQV
jgi:hypothetical protein